MAVRYAPMAPPAPSAASIFISYKRHVEPDNSTADLIFSAFQQSGYDMFIDRTMRVGQQWAQEIASKVRAADFLIVLLTPASCRSEMVRGELEIARGHAAGTSGAPRILPVRLAFTDPLPY